MLKAKTISLLAFFIVVSFTARAQISGSAKDAVTLKRYTVYDTGLSKSTLDLSKKTEWYQILNRHLGEDALERVNDDLKDLQSKYAANGFLKDLIPTDASSSVPGALEGRANEGLNLIESAGNLNVTNFADGLAQFLVDRAKQEINSYFFQRFSEKLEEQVELRVLFPKTYQLLQVIGVEIYHYNAYIENLRSAFKEDLSDLFVNFPKLLDEPKYAAIFSQPKYKTLGTIIRVGSYIFNEIHDGTHPGDILKNFPLTFGGDSLSKSTCTAIRFAKVVSAALEDYDDDSRYWINSSTAKKVVQDDLTIQLFLGLLYQSCPDDITQTINTGDGKKEYNLKTSLKNIGDQASEYQAAKKEYITYLDALYSKINDAETELNDLKTSISDNTVEPEDYANFFNDAIDLFEFVLSADSLPYFPVDAPKSASKIFYCAHQLSDIYLNVSGKDWAGAVTNTRLLLDSFFKKDVTNAANVQRKSDLEKRATAGTITDAEKRELSQVKKDVKNAVSSFKQKFFQYGTFMASMVNATSATDVEAAIEAAALPPGSSIIKRRTKCNIALQAYAGGFFGWEYDHKSSRIIIPENRVMGVAAPVGISLSKGILYDDGKRTAGSASLFLSLIDVGAVAAFRLDNDSVAALPEMKLQNILAPGAYFVYGIGNTPLSLNIGYQYGPALRRVHADEIEVASKLNGRLSIGITVDIPLFNFYTKGSY